MDGTRFLEDGKLTIFKRSGVYYARIRISPVKKYVWRSLKTSNEAMAIQLGRRLLFQIEQRAEQSLPPKSKKFQKVIDDYIRYRERDHRHGKTSAGMLRQIVRPTLIADRSLLRADLSCDTEHCHIRLENCHRGML
jgi:hypothetical protein